MASMQNGRILMSHPSSQEVEEMLLQQQQQHNGHGHGGGANGGLYGKMNGNGYYVQQQQQQQQSEQQQSLSLSSSNADSLDTVIYKGQAQGPSSQSIRDWQRSMDSGLEYQGGNGLYLDQQRYHVTQTANNGGSYQLPPLGYNGPAGNSNGHGGGGGNNFNMEYHRTQQGVQQQQQQQHQSLSIQSNQTGGNVKNKVHSETHSHHVRSGSTAGILSQPQSQQQYRNGGALVNGGGDKRLGSSNPQLASKSPVLSQKQLVVNESEQGKKDTKLFHNKTYNHIKDMISSRFGSANAANSVQNNNKVVNNDGSKVNGHLNNGYSNDSPPYGSQNAMNYGLQQQGQEYGGYYASPQAGSQQTPPPQVLQHRHGHSVMPAGGPLPPPSSYRSPALNDSRKNVNTSFRKAIQHSSQKSNLADESVQMMRSIMENSYRGQQQQQLQQQQHTDAERAQRALDKLCENGQMATGSPQYVNNRQQQQQTGYLTGNGETRNAPPSSADNNPHSRHRFNTKPGMISPPNNGMAAAVVENSHSVAFTKSIANHGIANEAFQGNDEYNEPPPPLPTSQQPAGLKQQDINTIGLPLSSEHRENGDGSSGSLETGGNKNLNEPSDNDQLKLSAELQKLALVNSNNEHLSSSSECEKSSQRVGSGQSHTTTDSGHGTVLLAKSPLHSSDPSEPAESSNMMAIHRQKLHEQIGDSISSGNDSEWVDIVEPEIRQILENEKLKSAAAAAAAAVAMEHERKAPPSYASPRSHQSSSKMPNGGSLGDLTSSAPAGGLMRKSPKQSPKTNKKYDLSYPKANEPAPGTSQQAVAAAALQALANARLKSPRSGGGNGGSSGLHRSDSGSQQQQQQLRLNGWSSRQRLAKEGGGGGGGKPGSSSRKELPMKPGKLTRSAMNQILYSLQDDNGDMTSTTTGLDLESMLDGATEATSDDDDLSTTIDTTDAYAIKRQIQSLETMYSEVLKVLHGKKLPGNHRYPPPTSDLRNAKRRPYGSMSSLPSSVSSRPFRERKKVDDMKKVKDLKSINRRFQRLESHVVTLARSVAHLSSEMRTQHLMVQEMESIRNEMSQLRNQVVKAAMQSHNNSSSNFARVASGRNGAAPHVSSADWSSFRNALPSLTNPSRVRKLTKFFGDEPPLIRIFLKKLGYEKYATAFEQERIGIMELPYLTEERLNKMGIPMGPRLRILQEAHSCLKPNLMDGGHVSHHHHQVPDGGKLSVYVV